MIQGEVFASSDGAPLYYEAYAPTAQRYASILIVHGYDDHAGRYRNLAQRLVDEGFGAVAFDYRGHGQASGKRGHCDRFGDYLNDLESALSLASSIAGPSPLVLLAQSFGALIALRWLCEPARMKGSVDAAVFCSPYLGPAFRLSWLESLALTASSRLAPALTFPNRLRAEDLTHDAAMAASRQGDPLLHGVATARWCTESKRAQGEVAERIHKVATPSLWLVAGADRVADTATSLARYHAVRAAKDLRLYDGFYHELFNEVGRDLVVSDLIGWLRARYQPQLEAVH